MAKKKEVKKAVKKTGPKKGIAYFTVQALERAVTKATKKKTGIAISRIGYTVVESNGWVVKKYRNGKEVRISKIEKTKRPSRLVLD